MSKVLILVLMFALFSLPSDVKEPVVLSQSSATLLDPERKPGSSTGERNRSRRAKERLRRIHGDGTPGIAPEKRRTAQKPPSRVNPRANHNADKKKKNKGKRKNKGKGRGGRNLRPLVIPPAIVLFPGGQEPVACDTLEPEVVERVVYRTETETQFEKVLYGAGIIALIALAVAGIAALFGYITGWLRRKRNEREFLESVLNEE